MSHYGFVRVAAATPSLRVADCAFNADRILALLERGEKDLVSVMAFPELCLTGYTCADLFQQTALQRAALSELSRLAHEARGVFGGLAIVGLPVAVNDQLFNCAALVTRGGGLG